VGPVVTGRQRAGVGGEGAAEVIVIEKAVVHAVHLGEHVGEEGSQPVGGRGGGGRKMGSGGFLGGGRVNWKTQHTMWIIFKVGGVAKGVRGRPSHWIALPLGAAEVDHLHLRVREVCAERLRVPGVRPLQVRQQRPVPERRAPPSSTGDPSRGSLLRHSCKKIPQIP